ncbi:uncharacterized protein [Euwallacea fornicatus]|uniref:uncharacterized protein n=1 Tax=Euwallacea fornicatus TaxID=995702 RepID=UPI00338E87FD
MKNLALLLLWCHMALGPITVKTECVIDPFEVDPHPLIVLSGSTDWIYPEPGEDVLRFDSGTSIDFLCPGRNVLINNKSTRSSILVALCVSDATFQTSNGALVRWKALKCSGHPWRDIRDNGHSCAADGIELEVGFFLGDGRFLNFLIICFNVERQIAYYTFIIQTAAINQRIRGTPRPSWLQGSEIYFMEKVKNIYSRDQQKSIINKQIGLPASSNKFIKKSGNYFLARGHLTARSDGFYAAQQNATFYMQNIAPQWQTFNGGNWNQVEVNLRDYIELTGENLWVWTGVHGVTTLPHQLTGEDIELYLFMDSNIRALPVPEIFYKVAFNPLTQAGVALIGVNNPYIEEFMPLCEDVSEYLSWFTCKSSLIGGYCYACTVDSFREVIDVLPGFSVKTLLV